MRSRFGFVSLMIMGVAAKVVPTLNGRDTRQLTALWGPFLLVNIGCFLRVSLQAMTDLDPRFFAVVGMSGILEVAGLAWWGAGLARIMIQGKRETVAADSPAHPHPAKQIHGAHAVADIVAWYPQTLDVFANFGFTLLSNPILLRTVARGVTVQQAAALHDVPVVELLNALNRAARR
jgi:hypothetical protein